MKDTSPLPLQPLMMASSYMDHYRNGYAKTMAYRRCKRQLNNFAKQKELANQLIPPKTGSLPFIVMDGDESKLLI